MKKYFKVLIAVVLYLAIIVINSKAYAMEGIVTKNTVRLREKASTDSDIVSLVAQDQKFEIVKEEGEWYKIKYTNDGSTYTGYVRKDMVEVDESETDSNKDTSSTETKAEETPNEEEATSEENKEVEETTSEENKEVEETKSDEKPEDASNVEKEENKESEKVVIEENSKIKIKNKLSVKILPLINSSNMSKIKEGSDITIVEILGNWCYIESEDKCGWTLLNKIEQMTEEAQSEEEKEEEKQEEENKEEKAEEEKEKLSKIAYISASTVNLREKADSSSSVIKRLSLNTKVTVVEEADNGWSKVEVSGKTGYVSSQYLSDKETEVSSRGEDETRDQVKESSKDEEKQESTKTESSKKTETKSSKSSNEKEDDDDNSSSSSGSTSGASVVSYAKKYVGSNYVWGASGPNSFDCSGFTMYVYKHFGYSLSHSSGAQASAGKSVSRSNLQQGDLVCYSGHVAIYAGGGKIVHAYNSRAGVVVSDMDSLYNKIVAYRRILD